MIDPPRLRPLEMHWIAQADEQLLLLRDPLRISQHAALLPAPAAAILSLCDGRRGVPEISSELAARTGARVPIARIAALLQQLDDALLLESPRFRAAADAALAAYRSAPCREPALAGTSYPADATSLARLLESYSVARSDNGRQADGQARGLLSPHIDYQRGGRVYAAVWNAVAASARAADAVVIFGTDHNGAAGSITCTRQSYVTPLGTLPTDAKIVDTLAVSVGDDLFADELHHRYEHSIELAAVWLQYMRDGKPVPTVPILVGSFHPYTNGDSVAATDAKLTGVIDTLRSSLSGRRLLVVSAGDLAHVGPAFGDDAPLTPAEKRVLGTADEALLGELCTGNAEHFLRPLRRDHDARRICGLPPTYMALRLLGDSRGRVVAYDQCPADDQGGSVVSVGGVVLS